MKIFLPPLDSKWRLLADWTPPPGVLSRHDNEETLFATSHHIRWEAYTKANPYNPSDAWNEAWRQYAIDVKAAHGTPEFVSGTVFSMERYHASRSGHEQLTIKLLASPCPLLNPRKLGGRMRGAGRLYLTLQDINTMPELEEAIL